MTSSAPCGTRRSPSNDGSILELVDVRAGYGAIEVLHGVDLRLRRGEVVALLGPNGGGKSTTLRVCSGLHLIRSGELRIAGRVVNGASPAMLARLGVCSIPEGRGVFPNLSVRENLWLATGTGVDRERVEEEAHRRFPGLRTRSRQLAGTLSGGEQQMLALARAFATAPSILLLDELSIGLSPSVVSQSYDAVSELAAQGASILVAEQFARTVLPIADSAAIMMNGRMVQVGNPDEIAAEIGSTYLGGRR